MTPLTEQDLLKAGAPDAPGRRPNGEANSSGTGAWSARTVSLLCAGLLACTVMTVASAAERAPYPAFPSAQNPVYDRFRTCEKAYASEPADGGAPVSSDVAGALPPAGSQEAATARPAERVEALLQMPELPAGCEAVSLTIVLRAMGFDVPLALIADSYLAIDSARGNFVTAFAGDPRSGGGAMPPAIVDAANAYLSERGAAETAHDLTGSSFAELLGHVADGRPVLVWTTMYMADPAFTGQVQGGYEWYSNEHCVVLYGTDGGDVLVSDPLEGLVRRDAAEFQRLYEACGSMAAVIW